MTVAGLPLGDLQFWAVTLITAAAAFLAGRRIARSLREPSACASCPKAARSGEPAPARPTRLPVLQVLLALAPLGLPAAAAARTEAVERRVAVMGTTLDVRVEADGRELAAELAELAVAAVEGAERRLSTWRGDSELARLNEAPVDAPVALSPETWRALADALRCARETDGAFDPTVAPLVEAWGLRTGGRRPSAAELVAARARVGWRELELDRSALTARRRADRRVEEGGFGKGAALDEALAAVRARASAAEVRLDLGGQLAWSGRREPQVIAIADPRARERPVLELRLDRESGSVSTSSNSERSASAGGERTGHLLDPRTGSPAPDFGSATAVDESATLADCRSTGMFVLGPDAAGAGSAAIGTDVVWLVVEGGRLRARMPAELAARARALVPELAIETVR